MSVGLLMGSNGPALTEEASTYWVSKNFSENPNVNKGWARSVPEFAPRIVNLGGLNRRDRDGDVRLCFVNWPLHNSEDWVFEIDDRDESPLGKRIRYCEHADANSSIGYFHRGSVIDRTEITKGLVISRSDKKMTCEAIFTAHSLYSLLYYRDARGKDVRTDDMHISPHIGGGFPAITSSVGLDEHLHPDDLVQAGGSDFRYQSVDLEKSWSCVVPAFRLYWQTALNRCQAGVEQLQNNPSLDEIHVPLVDELREQMLALTTQCRVKNQ